jgi:hypothetical protein
MNRISALTAALFIGFTAPAFATSSYANNHLNASMNTEVVRSAPSRWKLIPSIGAGASFITYDGQVEASPGYEVNVSTKQGNAYAGGLLVEYRQRLFSFQTGLMYNQFNMVLELTSHGTTDSAAASMTGHVDYLLLPFLAKLNLPMSREFCFTLKGGAAAGILLGVESSSEGWYRRNETAEPVSHSDHSRDQSGMRAVNALGVAGAGLEYNWADQWDLRLDALYLRTILPMNQFSNTKVYGDSIGAMFGVGYRI